MQSSYFTKIGACALSALFIAAALAAAGTNGANPGDSDADRGATEELSPKLADHVAAFRLPQTAADVIPGDPAANLEHLDDARPGETPELSRRLDVADGRYFYAWPERDGICRSAYGAGSCSPVWLLEQRGVLVGTYEHIDTQPKVHVYGVARDGIETVEFTLADGSSLTARIRDNGLMITLPTRPIAARWTNPDGTSGGQTFDL